MKTKKLLLALCAFMIMGGNAVMAQEQTIPGEFAKENITKEIIDKEVPQDDHVEILFFNRAEVIKNILMHEFEDADEALIDELIENIYQSIYEE